ncbi:MAG TPA: hypothetical protein PLP23_10375 [Panacibacter sp.]|nr:hypothetical protein [Panacibacter sp.]
MNIGKEFYVAGLSNTIQLLLSNLRVEAANWDPCTVGLYMQILLKRRLQVITPATAKKKHRHDACAFLIL